MPVEDSFDRVLKRLKQIPTPIPRIEVDGQPEMVVDELPVYRLDVFTLHWERLMERLKKVR